MIEDQSGGIKTGGKEKRVNEGVRIVKGARSKRAKGKIETGRDSEMVRWRDGEMVR